MSAILREIRKKHNLTQAKIASRLGVTRSAIAQIELGKNNISMDLAKKISKIFKVSLDDLINNNYSNIADDLYKNEDSFQFYDSYYFEISNIQLNLDKIEITKDAIKKFAKDKSLVSSFTSYETAVKTYNFDKLKSEFENKNPENLLAAKFIGILKKVVEICVLAILQDLYNIVTFYYKSIGSYYKLETDEKQA